MFPPPECDCEFPLLCYLDNICHRYQRVIDFLTNRDLEILEEMLDAAEAEDAAETPPNEK